MIPYTLIIEKFVVCGFAVSKQSIIMQAMHTCKTNKVTVQLITEDSHEQFSYSTDGSSEIVKIIKLL
jgi:hypothetical protein